MTTDTRVTLGRCEDDIRDLFLDEEGDLSDLPWQGLPGFQGSAR